MSRLDHALYFSVSTSYQGELKALADSIAAVLAVSFDWSTERGLRDRMVSQVFGMEIGLELAPEEPYRGGAPRRFVLDGAVPIEAYVETEWTDISKYVAAWLSAETKWTWSI